MKKIIISLTLALVSFCLLTINVNAIDYGHGITVRFHPDIITEIYDINIDNNTNGSYTVFKKNHINDGLFYVEPHEDFSFFIMPNFGYEIDKVMLNNSDITNEVKSGFLSFEDIMENKNIVITYKEKVKEEVEERYTITGVINYNGEPLKDVLLELHSEVKTTRTNADGEYIFTKVENGKHTLRVINNDVVLGYMEFEIKKDELTHFELNADGSTTINVTNESNILNINFLVNEDQTIIVEELKHISNPKTGDDILLYLLIGIISFDGILNVILYYKKRKQN